MTTPAKSTGAGDALSLFAPGRVLMRNLRYGSKAGLLAMLFALPPALLCVPLVATGTAFGSTAAAWAAGLAFLLLA
jgi:hypothetical protein